MSYINDNAVAFCTLAVGDSYRDSVATQLQSILKFTNCHAYVVTDKPEFFGNWYGPRVHFIQLDESLSKQPLRSAQGMFNYNLKLVPIKYVVEQVKPSIAIYMDADSFLFGHLPYHFEKYFPVDTCGVYGRFRYPLKQADDKLILTKLEMMGIDASNIETRLPIENILVFKYGNLLSTFFTEWEMYADLAMTTNARGDFEAIEMCLAIDKVKLPYTHMDGQTHPWVDCFRTVHHSKIHIPFII